MKFLKTSIKQRMPDYSRYINRLIQEKCTLLIANGYFTNTEISLKNTLRESIELALINYFNKETPMTFDVPSTIDADNSRKIDLNFVFHFDHDKRFLEITSLTMKEGEKEQTFQLPSSNDLPPAKVCADLLDASGVIRRMIKNSRIFPKQDNGFGKRLN